MWSLEWVHLALCLAGRPVLGWPLWSRPCMYLPWLGSPKITRIAVFDMLVQVELVEVALCASDCASLASAWPPRVRVVWLYRTGCDASICLASPPPRARWLCLGSAPIYSDPPLRDRLPQTLRMSVGWAPPREPLRRLVSLGLSDTRFCVTSLCRSLPRMPALRKLCVDRNNLSSDDAVNIVRSVGAGGLTHLEMGYNRIAEADELLESLGGWPLLYLGLGCNDLSALPLRPSATLAELVVECNELGLREARAIWRMLQRGELPRLRVLDMEDNLISYSEQRGMLRLLESRLEGVTLANGFS